MAEFNLGVSIDPKYLQARTVREARNLAYSTAQALNLTAQEVQRQERGNLDRKFKIRNATFMYRLIKITQFAHVGNNIPYAELAVDNTKSRVLLSIFEASGTKSPYRGKNVAVPLTGTAARPSWSASVPELFTFKGLAFKRLAYTQAGRALVLKAGAVSRNLKKLAAKRARKSESIFIGKQRTFILPYTAKVPYGGVFQRVGPKRDDIRLIYSFKPNPKLDRRLNFVNTARITMPPFFRETFARIYARFQNNS